MHALEVEGPTGEVETEEIKPGDEARLKVEVQDGTYKLYCPIGDHEARGMVGKLVVGKSSSSGSDDKGGEDDSGGGGGSGETGGTSPDDSGSGGSGSDDSGSDDSGGDDSGGTPVPSPSY